MSDDRKASTFWKGEDRPTRSSSKFVAVEEQDENGNWRVRIKSQQLKFDDEAKGRFLAEYAKHGRIGDSCKAAGVSHTTYLKHLESDTDFGEACLMAEKDYQSRLIAHHQDLVFEGTTKKTFDRQGNIVSEETIYPIPLIQMELRKHDEAYRDKREVDMKVSGGVLVAPSDVGTIEDWESKFAGGPVIEGTAEEIPAEDEG